MEQAVRALEGTVEEMPWEKGGAPGRGRRGAQLLKAPIQAFLWLLLNTPYGLTLCHVYVGHSPLLENLIVRLGRQTWKQGRSFAN